MAYPAQTMVPISKTKTDIEELLAKHGANGFGCVTEGNRALVAFNMAGRRVQIMLVMPSIDDFARTPRNSRRTALPSRRPKVPPQAARTSPVASRQKLLRCGHHEKLWCQRHGNIQGDIEVS